MFMAFAHRSAKKSIKKNTEWYNNMSPDHKAGSIFFIWLMRGFNLASLNSMNSEIELVIPIYYYKKGAESAMSGMDKDFKNTGNIPLSNACNHHYLTSIASSYPDQGYFGLIKRMWDALLSDYSDIQEVVDEILPQVTSTDYQKKQFLEYNDVTQDELIKNPRSIMPHFLVPGHPLSHKLLEEEKIGKSLVG